MKRSSISLTALLLMSVLPVVARAQSPSGGVEALHTVLQKVYDQMLPMCSQITDVCRAIAGLGCIFYIGVRVWSKIASAQPIELFPLLRPIVISILIGTFPTSVLGVLNGFLKPTVDATSALVTHYNDAVHALLIVQAKDIITGDNTPVLTTPGTMGSQQGWDKYAQPGNTTSGSDGSLWSAIGDGFKFVAGSLTMAMKITFRLFLSIFLELLYYAASLCIDTIRTFHLIVLAILGPFAFAFSCFDGTQNSLQHWIARYINIYLWLPIANLFGAILGNIQASMLQLDLERAQSGAVTMFSATDFAYLIFLAIGVVGYLTVPGIANYIVQTHGGNPLAKKVSEISGVLVQGAFAGATGGGGGAGGAGMAGAGGGSGTGSNGAGGGFTTSAQSSQYNHDRIAG